VTTSNKLESSEARASAREDGPRSRASWREATVKAFVIVGFYAVWLWAYDTINGFAADPVRTIHLTSPAAMFPWIIQPWTALIYITGGVAFALAPFVYYATWRGITFVMVCVWASSLMAFANYWAWPVSMIRPEFPGNTLGERLMLWIFLVDKPANCFPSLHVVFAVLGALLITRAGVGRAASWFWWTFSAAVSVSTITSGQHYFIDVPGGVAVALAGYSLGCWLMRGALSQPRPAL
jgi:membrane-associated phospholipid phosphatase